MSYTSICTIGWAICLERLSIPFLHVLKQFPGDLAFFDASVLPYDSCQLMMNCKEGRQRRILLKQGDGHYQLEG